MLFDESVIEDIKSDPLEGVMLVYRKVAEKMNTNAQDWSLDEADALYEAFALIVEVIELGLLSTDLEAPPLDGVRANDCAAIFGFLKQLNQLVSSQRSKLQIESMRSRFRVGLSNSFAYEFSQGDLDRVQTLLNELRVLISKADQLDDGHRQRLLKRLEKLQGELHKKVADLDRFWGLVGDAGVVLGKLGTDAKPIVDRIREVAGIVWQTQARSEELPSGSRPPSIENQSGDAEK